MYTVSDGQGGTNTATVTITVNGINDPPVAGDDSGDGFTTGRDNLFITGNVLDNDSDAEGDQLSIVTVNTSGTIGNVTNNNDGTFDYDPNGRFSGLSLGQTAMDSFTYTVTDGNDTDTATVTVTIVAGTVQFLLDTTDLLGTPISQVEANTPFLLHAFVQDIRGPDQPNTRGVSQAFIDVTFDSSLATSDGQFTYGPAYQELNDGNVTPGLVDEAGGSQTGFGFEPPFVGPLGSESFLLFSLIFVAQETGVVNFVSDPAEVPIEHDVTIFTPPVTVPSADIIYGTTAITVLPDPLVLGPDEYTTDEDTSFTTGNVLDNDLDAENDPISVSGFDTTGTQGIVTSNGDGTFNYDPNGEFEFLGPGQTATDNFTYDATDGENTDTGTVTIIVTGVNDGPIANDDSGVGFVTEADSAFVTLDVLTNDTDIDGGPLTVTDLDTTGTIGQVTSNGNGTFNYDPNGQFDIGLGQVSTDTFSYTVSDGNGGTDTATVTVTIRSIPTSAGGFVYVDSNNDGQKDDAERAIGGVEVRLKRVDIPGQAPIRVTTDASGRFDFAIEEAGIYKLIEDHPYQYVDGIDTVNGVINVGANDRITIDTANASGNQNVLFGERSLQPDFISMADFLNDTLRQGIVVGLDASGNQLWYSLLDGGWDGIAAVDLTFSNDESIAHLTVSLAGGGDLMYDVPTALELEFFRERGENSLGRVVQLIGTAEDFEQFAVDAAFAELGG